MLEPDGPEEELFALRAALQATRTPTGFIGGLGLLISGLLAIAGVVTMLDSPIGGLVYLGVAAMYALMPGLLVVSILRRPADIDDIRPFVWQARVLTVFWMLGMILSFATAGMYLLLAVTMVGGF